MIKFTIYYRLFLDFIFGHIACIIVLFCRIIIPTKVKHYLDCAITYSNYSSNIEIYDFNNLLRTVYIAILKCFSLKGGEREDINLVF